MRKREDKHCWDIDKTLCGVRDESMEEFQAQAGSKKAACEFCLYYQQYQ